MQRESVIVVLRNEDVGETGVFSVKGGDSDGFRRNRAGTAPSATECRVREIPAELGLIAVDRGNHLSCSRLALRLARHFGGCIRLSKEDALLIARWKAQMH